MSALLHETGMCHFTSIISIFNLYIFLLKDCVLERTFKRNSVEPTTRDNLCLFCMSPYWIEVASRRHPAEYTRLFLFWDNIHVIEYKNIDPNAWIQYANIWRATKEILKDLTPSLAVRWPPRDGPAAWEVGYKINSAMFVAFCILLITYRGKILKTRGC